MSKDVQFKQQVDALSKAADVDVDAEHDPETSRKASNTGLRREAAVQKKASGQAAGDVQGIAAQGVKGGGAPLPHLDKIQSSFGAHDVSGIQAHTGGDAAQASNAMGAQAYATGNNVAFAGQPDLHTAAHEAAHVVQQRGGVSLKSKVGEAGDSYERTADEVADRVVAGKPAGDLLGAPKNSAAPAEAVQKKDKKDAKETTETKEATPEEKAAADKESDAESRKAIYASIMLLAKDMHTAIPAFDKIQQEKEDRQRPGQKFHKIMDLFNNVFGEASRLRGLLASAKLPDKEKGYLFGAMQKLEGARAVFVPRLGQVAGAAGEGVLDEQIKNFNMDMGVIYSSVGENYKTGITNRDTVEPSQSTDALQNDAIRAHLSAAKDAALSASAGNADVGRVGMHLLEVHNLAPSIPHAMRPFKAEVKEVADAVKMLEKAHPELAAQLKQADGLIKELTTLSK